MFERIVTREAIVGDSMPIRRALPTVARRTIGAWCFLDHAGPVVLPPGPGMRVGPHPHIGLQTFTWQIEGETLHRDSLGSEQLIRPGQVNLMTAGRGISHSEESARRDGGPAHLAQLWIALPESRRWMEPRFAHHAELPGLDRGGFRLTLLAGEALGAAAPPEVYTPIVGIDLASGSRADAELPLEPAFEYGVLVLDGSIEVDGEALAPGTLLYVAPSATRLRLASAGPSRALLLGGEPFAEPLVLWWNFVARDQNELAEATRDWNTGAARFGEVRGYDGPRLVAPDVSALKLHVR